MMTWNMYDFVMLGMAQFLDCNFDSDEDFEETSRQGREELFFFKLGETFILRNIVCFLRFSFRYGNMLDHDEDAISVYQLVSYIIRRRGESCWPGRPRGWKRSRARGQRG